ncbi:hypothetical protein [Herbaspirillum sp.]|uniref:hypothetical protein n=1 Tax=Herbaspirillum sp. TaxID=1890675 RepID=UPI001B221577|nr:hypothetical protein [Herbaspirillum sp.]MBO9538401.1 hypothetical protein [Herbaspirillum sp.]
MTNASFRAAGGFDIVVPSPQYLMDLDIEFEPATRKPGGFSFLLLLRARSQVFPYVARMPYALRRFRNSPMVAGAGNAYHEHQ